MLSDLLAQKWLQATGMEEAGSAVAARDLSETSRLLENLTSHAPDQARHVLADVDPTLRRKLAVLLLDQALHSESPAEAATLAEWAEFVGSFGDAERLPEGLEAHFLFFKAVLEDRRGRSTDALEFYAKAEIAYAHSGAGAELRALAAYAWGAAALDLDLVESGDADAPCAREKFRNAAAIGPVKPALGDEIAAAAGRGLAQWELINRWLAGGSATPLALNDELVDQGFLRILHARMCRLAATIHVPVEKALQAAKLVEAVSASLGAPIRATAELIGYYHTSKRLDAAELLLREELRDRPDDSVLVQLGYVLSVAGRHAEARTLLEEAVRLHPENGNLHASLAAVLAAAGRLEEARDENRRALELKPDHELVSWVERQIEALENPRRTANPGTTFHFEDGDLTISAGPEALGTEDLAAGTVAAIVAKRTDRSAETAASRAGFGPLSGRPPAGGPATHDSYFHLGMADESLRLERWPDAIAAYRAAIARDPNLAPAYAELGEALYRTGKFYAAAEYLEESTAIRPAAGAFRLLGDCCRRIGKTKAAADAYRSALDLKPDYLGAKTALRDVLEEAPL